MHMHMQRRIGIVGGGSLGCYLATRLGQYGAPVTIIARAKPGLVLGQREVAVSELKEDSKTLVSKVKVDVAYGLEGLMHGYGGQDPMFDLVFVTVKHKDTRSVGEIIREGFERQVFRNPLMPIVSLQNGMGNKEILSSTISNNQCPNPNILSGLTYMGAAMIGDLHCRHNGKGDTFIACSQPNETLKTFQAAMANANSGTGVTFVDEQEMCSKIWTKLLVNCIINPLTALNDQENGSVANPHFTNLVKTASKEFISVTERENIALELNGLTPEAFVHMVAIATKANTSSMLADVRTNRETEIEALNGYVVNLAREKYELSLPVLESMYHMVKAMREAKNQS